MGSGLSFPTVPLTKDKVVVVTGGNTGIGYETAKWIAMYGAHVIIACRSEERATKAIERMNQEFAEEKARGTEGLMKENSLDVHFMKLDCASLKSTREFIETFKQKESKLHLLLLNAGIAMHEQEYTDDGYELMFQVNYLSHFLITSKLLPIMRESGEDCRIVLVSSDAHLVSSFDMDKIQGKQYTKANFSRMTYYGNSKLYQIMQMYSLNKKLHNTNVTVNCIHPGIVETEISRSFSDLQRWKVFFRMTKLFGGTKTPFEGAKTLINAAINPKYKDLRNAYHTNCKPSTSNRLSRNEHYQDQLWEYTLGCLKEYLTEEDIQKLQ
ncbi:hypothetical protein FSP39_016282 [Pinctada imbricata]|uniref:Uncharacterized protein n=1 Tax=Pinctada imbricata TaxID=66713 RepID=A0AA88Y4W9_PINIB|nr:hypothetical protein FSP39_016282 [Pinctada imbricata]